MSKSGFLFSFVQCFVLASQEIQLSHILTYSYSAASKYSNMQEHHSQAYLCTCAECPNIYKPVHQLPRMHNMFSIVTTCMKYVWTLNLLSPCTSVLFGILHVPTSVFIFIQCYQLKQRMQLPCKATLQYFTLGRSAECSPVNVGMIHSGGF